MSLGAAIRSYSLDAMQSEAPTPGQRAWRLVLTLGAAGYGVGVAVRGWTFASRLRPVRRLPCPVICIGNLTVGGSGKTPCTLALAQWFQARGRHPGILLRGYGRHGSGVTVAADAREARARWEAVGDEAVLLARRLAGVPVVVGANRFQAGLESLRRFRLDLLLLDDGFQHRQLHRDLDLVMVDATDPFGGGRLLPRGRLREPISRLGCAHAIILSRTDQARDLAAVRRALAQIAPGVVQILTRHRPSRLRELAGGEELPLSSLQGRRLLAVSGIANPAGFHGTLAALGGIVAGEVTFPDHHPYAPADLSRVAREAREARAELVVTTEKDAVRMPAAPRPEAAAAAPIRVLEVELEVTEGTDALERLLLACGEGARG